jgi:hypothetical protein
MDGHKKGVASHALVTRKYAEALDPHPAQGVRREDQRHFTRTPLDGYVTVHVRENCNFLYEFELEALPEAEAQLVPVRTCGE